MKYSASKRGFYDPDFHGDAIPADVVDVTDEAYAALFAAQASGSTIQPDAHGNPVAVAPAPAATPPPQYVPAGLIRERLQAAGLWTAAVTGLMADPEKMLWFTTLRDGILPGDPIATPFLQSIGADPTVILAAPS